MGEDSEHKHIEKHICDGFDRTDWSLEPSEHDDFTLHAVEKNHSDKSSWPIRENHPRRVSFLVPGYVKKRVKVYGSLAHEPRHKGGKGQRKYMHNTLTPTSEVDQLRSDIKAVLIIGIISVVLMFTLYFAIVISFMM